MSVVLLGFKDKQDRVIYKPFEVGKVEEMERDLISIYNTPLAARTLIEDKEILLDQEVSEVEQGRNFIETLYLFNEQADRHWIKHTIYGWKKI